MVEPSKELQLVFDKAVNDAKKLQHEYITLEHLLFAMLCEETFGTLVKGYGTDVVHMQKELETYLKTHLDDIKIEEKKYKPKKTTTVERVLNRAFTQVLFQGRNDITIADVFISLLSEKKSWAFFITQKFGITKEKFQDYISAETETYDNQDEAENMGAANKALRDFTTDLNHQVSMNKIDPVIGRGEEIEQVALALGRRTKSNVLIVGDPGVVKLLLLKVLHFKL